MKRPQFVSVRDTAKALGVSIKFVYDLIWAGKLQANKVGKVWRVPIVAIEVRLKERGQ